MRTAWTELPGQLQAAIKDRAGRIRALQPATRGNHADFASTLHTSDGRVFVKAARKVSTDVDGPEVRALRWEAAINPYVAELAPRLLWRAEAGEWLALGFEHVAGRHADYSPGSPDLAALDRVIRTLQETVTPEVVKGRVERRWTLADVDVSGAAGDVLLHTDINADNLLITPDERVYLVDWAFVARGAAWVELGLMIPWLIKAGHSPSRAAAWAERFPAWNRADSAAIDAFSMALAQCWRVRCEHNQAEWVAERAALTRQWAEHRLRGREVNGVGEKPSGVSWA
ncbi:phosphotransferase [Actinoallomurus sp. NPDC052308]|uniref:phosphotransferase family protein n=1 Tax=Actinoallomurus sp. NPDC052308 TaxID=3155530 RepID=UPI003446A1F5